MSVDIATLGIRVDALEARLAAQALEDLARAGGRAERSTGALSNATAVLSKVYGDLAKAAAAWKVYDYIKDAALLNARYETLGISMTQVGKNVGYTADQMEAAAKSMQKAGISMTESRSAAMSLVQAHINLADSSKLARVAQDAAVIGNINSSEAFGRLVHGIQSAQVEILRGIGINVSFEQGYSKTAATLNKTSAQLTENEKAQSRLNLVMEKGSEIAGTYEASMSTAGKQMSSMKRYTEDLKVKVGEVFNETLTISVMAFTDQMKGLNKEMDAVAMSGQLNDWAEGVTNLFVTIADNANNLVGALKVIGLTTAALAAASNLEIWDGAGRSAIKEQYDRDVDAIYAGEDRFGKALEKRRAARAEDVAKLHAQETQKLEQVRSDLSAYAKALEGGLLTQQQYTVATAAIMKSNYGDNHFYVDTPGSSASTKKGPSEYDALVKGIQEKIALDQLDLQTQGQLSSAQKEVIKVMEDLRLGTLKLTEGQKIKLTGLLETRLAVDEQKTSEERLARADQEAAQARNRLIDSLIQGTKKLKEDTESQKDSISRMGLSKMAIAELDAMKLESQATTIDLMATKQLDKNLDLEQYNLYKAQSEELRKQAALKRGGAAKETELETANAATEAWKRSWDETDRMARDAFAGWAENGTSMAEAIGKSLKKTLLSAIYEATIRPIAFQIFNSTTGGAAGAAGGSALGSALGGYASSVGLSTGATAFGGSFTAGIGGGAEAFSAGATMVAEAQGLTSAMAGAGQMLGAAMPYLAAAMVIYSLISNRPNSASNTGDSSATYGSNGSLLALQSSNGLTQGTTDLTAAMQASYVATAKNLGISLAQTNYNVNTNNGANAENPNSIIDSTVNGVRYTSGEISNKDTGALQLAASRAVLSALQASDLPSYMAGVLRSVSASTASQEQISGALQYAQALRQVRDSMTETRTQTEILNDTVSKGFLELGTSAEGFKSDFVKVIDSGLTPEIFTKWGDLKAAMDSLAESSKTAADALRATQSSTLGSIGNIVKSIDAMHSAVAAADGRVLGAQDNIRNGYLDAQQNLNDLLLQASQNTLTFINSISTFLDTISPSSGGGSLASLKAQLSSTAVLAKGGDSSAQTSMVAQAQAVLSSAKTSSRTSVEYSRNEAFVRNLLTDVKTSLTPSASLADDANQSLDAQIKAQREVVDQYSSLVKDTGTSIIQSSGSVEAAITSLKLSYDSAVAEQASANARLDVALAALDILDLSEAGLKLILASQSSDFAAALGVTNADIQTLTEALGLSEADVNNRTGKLKVQVEDVVYTSLKTSLGPAADLYSTLSTAVGPRKDLVKDLGMALGVDPIQLLNLNSALNLTDSQKLALAQVLGMGDPEKAKLSTSLGYDQTQFTALATSVGLSADASKTLTNAATAIGLAVGMDKTLTDLKTQVGFSVDADQIQKDLVTRTGFSADAITMFDDLATKVGFSAESITTARGLGKSIGIMDGVTSTLSTSLGLSSSTIDALKGFSGDLASLERASKINRAVTSTDPIGASYQTLFGRSPEEAGRKYWEESGLSGMSLFNAISSGAQGDNGSGINDLAAKKLRGFAGGTSYIPSDGPAYLHSGEEVTPRPFVDKQSNERAEANRLLARLITTNEALRSELIEIRKASAASAKSNEKAADLLSTHTQNGRPLAEAQLLS